MNLFLNDMPYFASLDHVLRFDECPLYIDIYINVCLLK